MAENATRNDRVAAEIELLQAMYPELEWNEHRQEVKYVASSGANLIVRIPGDYPGSEYPILISAFHGDKTDLRDLTKSRIESRELPLNEEILDTIIQAFEETIQTHDETASAIQDNHVDSSKNEIAMYKTVVIWLHHLLNTNKRKLALNPSVSPNQIVGVTKPGYPGILVYSGSVDAIDAHVAELKDQRWQAFQVRYEETMSTTWTFTHDSGITEVESMSEVVQGIKSKEDQTTFLHVVGVK